MGNILLIGKNGIGRKSAVKIMSALLSAKLVTPESDEQQFQNTLKSVSCICLFIMKRNNSELLGSQ